MKFLLLLALAISARAQTSPNYALTSTAFGEAGGPQTSDSYRQDTMLGGTPGMGQAPGSQINRSGLIAQYYNPATLTLAPSPADVAEGASLQLAATVGLDDDTTLALAPGEVVWQIAGNLPAVISAAGMVTAGYVYMDTVVRVDATYGSLAYPLTINIHNRGDDDFGIYGNDGISDIWQVGYFGVDNPLGRAWADPDGDGQSNAFEFLSGYSPIDGNARLTLRVISWDGQFCKLELSRVQTGTVYDIEISLDLVSWSKRVQITPTSTVAPFGFEVESPSPIAFFRVGLRKAP